MDASTPREPPTAPSTVPHPGPFDVGCLGHGTARLPAGGEGAGHRAAARQGAPRPRRPAPTLTPSRLDDGDLRALTAIVGTAARRPRTTAARVCTSAARARPTCCARRLGDPQAAPDAVVVARTHAETLAVLAVCAERGIAVVPFGGGTSVVGGVDPSAARSPASSPSISRAPPRFSNLDETSLLATFGAGTTGPQAEELLGTRGYTIGHFPQSFEYASIGGYAATRSSGQASRGYGRFDDLVHALRVATPVGELRLGRAPASAAGPDLRELFLGSEGAFGVLTEITVRIRPLPGRDGVRSVDLPGFRVGGDGPPRAHAARHPSDRPSAERCERDAGQRG